MSPLLRRAAAAVLPLCLLAGAGAAGAEEATPKRAEEAAPKVAEEAAPKVIADGSKVSIEYTLKLDDGSTADTNVGQEPLVYEQGKGQMLPALEKQLLGLKVNDTRKVDLSAEEGYGAVDPDAFHSVPADQIPAEGRTPGAVMIAEDGSGRRQQVRVHEVKGDQIVVDMNHPLAGKALHFDVKILAIQ